VREFAKIKCHMSNPEPEVNTNLEAQILFSIIYRGPYKIQAAEKVAGGQDCEIKGNGTFMP